jgi:acyl-CoA synthetase (AMP-forming)/AMP-acid ligase II
MEDPFRMIPTGGTTGVSKGVVHSHGGTLMTVLTNIADFGIRRGWKTVLIAPAYHGAGMDWGLFPILWRAGTVIMPPEPSFNPGTYFRLLREHAVEYALLVPATIGPLYRTWDRVPVTSVKTLISTSAPTAPALREKLAEMFPTADCLAGAGISESLNMAIQAPGDFLAYSAGIGEPQATQVALRATQLGKDQIATPFDIVGVRGVLKSQGLAARSQGLGIAIRIRLRERHLAVAVSVRGTTQRIHQMMRKEGRAQSIGLLTGLSGRTGGDHRRAFRFHTIFHPDRKLGSAADRQASTTRMRIVAGDPDTRPRSSSIGSRVPRRCSASASA